MKNLKIFICLILMNVLFACNKIGKYNTYLDTQIGLSKYELISSWGATNSMKLNNKKELFSYERQYGERNLGQENKNTGLITTYVDKVEDTLLQQCFTNFLVENGKVVKWGHTGDNCIVENPVIIDDLKKNIGLNKDKLINKWGTPKFSVTIDTSVETLTYYYSKLTFMKDIEECFTNFTLKNNKVAKITQRGNGCKSANKIYIKR